MRSCEARGCGAPECRFASALVRPSMPLTLSPNRSRRGGIALFLFEVLPMNYPLFFQVLRLSPLWLAFARRDFAHLGDFLLNAGPLTMTRGRS